RRTLDETTTLWQTILDLTLLGHPDHRSFLVKVAGHIYGRFRATGAKEDLDEVIAGALELPSPGNSERWSVPINLTYRLCEVHECQVGEFRGRSSLWWPLVGSVDDPNRRSCVIRKATAGLDEVITL
ncbi:hypothetical protein M404DRAFT_171405, partial [Pisolithus tinctorius Marx 270]